MDQHNYSIIASVKTCPRDGCQMQLARSGSTFVWRCTCCDYTEPLNERHTFTFNPLLNELRIAWPGLPGMTRYLNLDECYQLQALLNRELPAVCPYLTLAQAEVSRS